MSKNQVVALEKSTNTHITKSEVEVIASHHNMNTVVLRATDTVIVEHGHHNTVATEPSTVDVIKITQQEYNPVTQAFRNSFD